MYVCMCDEINMYIERDSGFLKVCQDVALVNYPTEAPTPPQERVNNGRAGRPGALARTLSLGEEEEQGESQSVIQVGSASR